MDLMQTNQTIQSTLDGKANSTVRVFNYEQLPVRTVTIEGEPWFVAKDVCDVLEIRNPSSTLGLLDDDEKMTLHSMESHSGQRGGAQFQTVVSESGLYSLILRSRKPEAKRFKRWITREVIPALRKTGTYQLIPQANPSAQNQYTLAEVLSLALQSELERQRLSGQLAKLLPKARLYDRVAGSEDTFSLGETAKLLKFGGYGRNNLIHFLRAEGILMTNNIAVQRYVDRGYFCVVQRKYTDAEGVTHARAVTRVYEKGIDFICRRLAQALNEKTGGESA
jgi:anti-repressor protein